MGITRNGVGAPGCAERRAASGLVLGAHGPHRRARWERKEQDSARASPSVKLLEVGGGVRDASDRGEERGRGGVWKRTGRSETGPVGPGDWPEPAAGVSGAACGVSGKVGAAADASEPRASACAPASSSGSPKGQATAAPAISCMGSSLSWGGFL